MRISPKTFFEVINSFNAMIVPSELRSDVVDLINTLRNDDLGKEDLKYAIEAFKDLSNQAINCSLSQFNTPISRHIIEHFNKWSQKFIEECNASIENENDNNLEV